MGPFGHFEIEYREMSHLKKLTDGIEDAEHFVIKKNGRDWAQSIRVGRGLGVSLNLEWIAFSLIIWEVLGRLGSFQSSQGKLDGYMVGELGCDCQDKIGFDRVN